MPQIDIDKLLAAMNEGSYQSRCAAIRSLCPCRNNRVRDLEVWAEIFRNAREGGLRERDQAAHAIGTLTEKAAKNDEWRDLLYAFRHELDALMRDTRSARVVLGQMKKHGHAHRGAARQGYRRRRTILDLKTPKELADWVNGHLGCRCAARLSSIIGVSRCAYPAAVPQASAADRGNPNGGQARPPFAYPAEVAPVSFRNCHRPILNRSSTLPIMRYDA
ncbi:MAG: hypothetical protein OXU77_07080 [Gammaproteobacteria bacterium]|nr:hypothetical protein [Gammaproteobacteria bacterium]